MGDCFSQTSTKNFCLICSIFCRESLKFGFFNPNLDSLKGMRAPLGCVCILCTTTLISDRDLAVVCISKVSF